VTYEGAFPADPAACSPAFTSTSMPLIAGKLHAPVQASGYLPRPRLDPLLARTLDDAVRLTLLSAGAGYGKSVAVAGWLAAGGVPYAWLSLDGADNDPVRFLRYLVGALEPVRPAVAALPGEGLEKLPAVEQAALLIDALAASDDPFVLVLDDYHVITAEPIHALLRVLIEQGPPFAHLVVVTREDPPFPLPRLRAHGRLVEIRARELRYTEDEAVDYLGSASGVQLDEGQVGQLVGRTEGWIAGLQLAAISLRDRPATPMIASFTGSQRHVLDYLGSEVVDGLDPDMRMMLVSASVADRFTANLCDRLVDRSDSARLLDAAERMNLFLIPLDDTCCWYRFHHLFGAYLRTLLEPAEEHTLRDRAADFLEGEGLYDEAIPQAIEAGSIERAVRLLEAHGRATYESGELSTLLRWLDALPDGATESSAELCALRAWSAFNVGRVGDAMRVCEAAEAAHAGERPTASILAVRATVAAFTNRPGAIELAQAALADTEADPFYLMLARYALAVGQLSAGRLEAAMASAREVLPQAWGPGRSTLVVPAVTTIASSLLYLGRRDEAEALCRETLEAHRAEARSLAGGTPYAMHWLGMTLYEAGEVEAALVEMERGWAAMGTFGFGRAVLTFAAAWLALARLAAGSLPGALEVVRTMRRDAASAGLTGVDEAFAEMEARVQALSGEVAAAARWADALEAGRPRAGAVSAPGPAPEPVTEPGDRWSELAPSITLARVRLAQGRCQEAAEHLRRARAIAESIGHVADLVSIGVLEAAVALRGGDRAMAQSRLEHAVQNAAPARYIQRFVDDGALVAPLLAGVRSTAPAFVDEVTRAMAVRSGAEVRVPVERGARTPSTGHEPLLVEPLTDRELEVLGLIARGLSDAAIADELVVSLATAKWHAAHIRGKLGVTTRTQAVLRAQELALV
jgi:LuxR family maltose regulon positive regulatory protein